MKKIEEELYTPHQKNVSSYEGSFLDGSFKRMSKKEWDNIGGTVNKVRASEGYKVNTFRELINEIALVTISNRNYEMFYRGQSKDYLNNQSKYYSDRKPKSTILPSICRPDLKEDGSPKYSVRKQTIRERYEKLFALIEFINKSKKFSHRDEYLMSLFQHYEICPTPLIDITQSLRVAATFALKTKNKGYVYVFGLPYPNQSTSYFIDSGIILLKLQNIMSTNALRPRYQEGYLVGKFPFDRRKSQFDDLSNRMVAKFFIDNSAGTFWDEHFLPMPDDVLYPKNDAVENWLKELKLKFENQYRVRK
ncbi:FRG domain-containing protein [Sediminibacterium sp.]|uniref:FRG domain-containing protein n=1 Tax=Sediminibacterium sp. TaxID=1917865 RepID=UPI0025FD74CA|nr:FRG domain-containing protein [Sediminibacterium sp.]